MFYTCREDILMAVNFSWTNISFGSLKAQKSLGEKMMKEYRKNYPQYFHSNTLVTSFIIRHNGDRAFKPINKNLQSLADRYNEEIDNVRKKYGGNYDSWSSFIDDLKRAVLSENAANCGEQAFLMQDVFLKNGEEAHNVCMTFYTKKDKIYGNHSFVVSGLSRNADIANPKTWGNEAVVTDPWSNVVLGAREAIDYFRKILGFNPKYHRETFEKNDKIDVRNYLEYQKELRSIELWAQMKQHKKSEL